MKNRDEILKKAKVLVSLLEDNEDGYASWHKAVHDTIEEIKFLYSGKINKEGE